LAFEHGVGSDLPKSTPPFSLKRNLHRPPPGDGQIQPPGCAFSWGARSRSHTLGQQQLAGDGCPPSLRRPPPLHSLKRVGQGAWPPVHHIVDRAHVPL